MDSNFLQYSPESKDIKNKSNYFKIEISKSELKNVQITEENKLVTAKRLNVAEKSWSKLAKHFTLYISDRDTRDLAEIQRLTETWKELMGDIAQNLDTSEKNSKKNIEAVQIDIQKLKDILIPAVM